MVAGDSPTRWVPEHLELFHVCGRRQSVSIQSWGRDSLFMLRFPFRCNTGNLLIGTISCSYSRRVGAVPFGPDVRNECAADWNQFFISCLGFAFPISLQLLRIA